jgi:hypothetical protein
MQSCPFVIFERIRSKITMKRIRKIALLTVMVTALTSCQMPWQDKQPDELGVKPDAPFVLKGVSNLTQVAQITGYESINKTHEYEIYGTDLGSMFNYGDKTYLVFGDTFGYRPSLWRSEADEGGRKAYRGPQQV